MKSKNASKQTSIAVIVVFLTIILCSVFPSGVIAEDGRIVKGIIEENNPQLGYVTLYNEAGTGIGKPASLRTYNYLNPNKIKILKNYKTAAVASIEAGDTAYVKIDSDGNVLSISAVDNYYLKYGRIIWKTPNEIAVEFDDGIQQLIKVGGKVLVIRDKKLDSYSSIKDGDKVRLQLSITEKATILKEITIEGEEHLITDIYKGEAFEINDMTSSISVLNIKVLNKGKWERTDKKGFTGILLSEDCKFYYDDTEIDLEDAAGLLSDNQAYVAVEKDYGGDSKAVLISFRNELDTEVVYNDNIAGSTEGSGSFSLDKELINVKYGTGSIIVKNNRLVTAESLSDQDSAVVIANRSYSNGDFNAGVVKIDPQTAAINGQLYRARISKIDDDSEFTVESYSQLNGTDWEYSNTPKTFELMDSTRLLDDDGIADMRKFIGYGTDSYIGRTVYIVADDTNALAISTVPFGAYTARGTVYSIKGSETGEEGTLIKEPDELMLRDTAVYDATSFLWQDAAEMDINLLNNSLIFKDGKLAKASDIAVGDTVKVIRKETGVTGTAVIIIVE